MKQKTHLLFCLIFILAISHKAFPQQSELIIGKWLLVKHTVSDNKGKQKDIFEPGDVRTFEIFKTGRYKLTYTSKQPGIFIEEGDWDLLDTIKRTMSLKLFNNGLTGDDPGVSGFYALPIKKLTKDELIIQEYIYYEKNLKLIGTSYYVGK